MSYTFDPNGNLVAQVREGAEAAPGDAGGPGKSGKGGQGAPGPACAGEKTLYHYDDVGRLVGVEGAGGLALNYVYDGAGRMVGRWASSFPEGLPPGIAMLLREGPGHGRAQGKGLESGKWWQEWGSGPPGQGRGGGAGGGGGGKGKGGGQGKDGHGTPGGGGQGRPGGTPGQGRGKALALKARLGLEEAAEGRGPLEYVRYVNDVLQPAARVLGEYDGEGALRQRFVYGPGRLAAEGGAWGTVYPLADALGSPRLLAGPSGRWLAALDYEAFGTPDPGPGPGGSFEAASARTGNPFGFCGELYDPRSGLLYLRARHYDPLTGRFTSPDLCPADAHRPGGLNRYSYCAGDPVNFTDPLGLIGIELQMPVAGVISSRFGMRQDPFTDKPTFHSGIDITTEAGTPVQAAMAGELGFAGVRGGYGNTVIVRSGEVETLYGHLSGFPDPILRGEVREVEAGDVIGFVGSTGRSTGFHLHFEVRVGGEFYDPADYLPLPPN